MKVAVLSASILMSLNALAIDTINCQQAQGGGRMEYSISFKEPYESQGKTALKVFYRLDEQDARVSYDNITKARKTFKGSLSLNSFDVLMVDRWVSTRVIGRIRAQQNASGDWKVNYQPWSWKSDERGTYYLPSSELSEKQLYCYSIN